MQERRSDDRLFCADLVEVRWSDTGAEQRRIANLEDISHSGICLSLDLELSVGQQLIVRCGTEDLRGYVRHCSPNQSGFTVGVEFHPDKRWSADLFRPQHLLDPMDMFPLKPLPDVAAYRNGH